MSKDSEALVRQLRRELDAVRPFVSVADTNTEVSVIEALEGINYDVQNLSHSLGERLTQAMPPRARLNIHSLFPHADIAQRRKAYESSSSSEEALALHIQSSILRACHEYANCWNGHSIEVDSYMHSLLSSVLEGEEAAISGNIKAILHRHAILIEGRTRQDMQTARLRASLASAVEGCGITHSSSASILDAFSQDLENLACALIAFKDSSRLGVISGCLETLVIGPGTPISLSNMEIGLQGNDDGGVADQRVLCTIALGLVRCERGVEPYVLLSPKIATESVLLSLE